uniref:Serine/threonine-protein kinase 40 n=1 Tax=Anopheles farauti TaxID=69004 RepID=A0A182QIZ1_9DIPT
MFRARKQLGKRQTADNGNGFRPKKFRTDQQVPTYDEDGQTVMAVDGGADGQEAAGEGAERTDREGENVGGAFGAAGGAANVSKYARRIVRGQTGNVLLDCEIPRYGTPVERKRCRKAGDFVIGYELGTSPGVPQTQYLARKQDSNEFYLLKILSFDPETEVVDKETLQGKVLLHNEFTLLSMLDDLDGVIHQHGFFSDYAFEERQIDRDDGTVQSIYTGRIRRRLILVLDCVYAHEFSDESSAYISLQRHISVARIGERDALELFYEVVKVVEQLHARNIIHRDLKLNNIVLDRRTGRVVLTNFFLGKHLINDQECLFDQRGSPAYISPDVLGGKPYRGKPSDMWALGVILYTIVFGKFPFLDTTPTALFRKIREADYTIPSGFNITQETKSLIKRMLTLNPDERLTATEVRVELEQHLRKFRRPRLNCDQLVPELPNHIHSQADELVQMDQSTPTDKEPVGATAPPEPMDVDGGVEKPTTTTADTSPRFDLSTEQFSRVLEANGGQRRVSPKPKMLGTYKKVTTTTFRVTPSSLAGQLHQLQSVGDGAQQGQPGQPGQPSQQRRSNASANVTGTPAVSQRHPGTAAPTAAAAAAAATTGADGGGGGRNRFNFNLNLQYTASSYNSAARAVVAAVAAVRNAGTSGGGANRTRMEWTRNGISTSNNNPVPPSPQLGFNRTNLNSQQPVATASQPQQQQQQLQLASSPAPSVTSNNATESSTAEANAGQTVNRPPLPPAAQRLYSIMNYISQLNRSVAPEAGAGNATRPPPPPLSTLPVVDEVETTDPGLDFNGIITPSMADKIVAYLIVNLRSLDWVVDVFRSVDGGANEPEHRVNNLLELLLLLGVRMEACNGQIVIRAEQTRERHQFLRQLLKIAGYNDKYFTQRVS